jgi:hypothetical protein
MVATTAGREIAVGLASTTAWPLAVRAQQPGRMRERFRRSPSTCRSYVDRILNGGKISELPVH